MNISTDIKNMLAKSGWTQDKLAAEAGVHPTTLSNMLKRIGTDDDKSALGRIWPYIYGDKRPPAKSPAAGEETRE